MARMLAHEAEELYAVRCDLAGACGCSYDACQSALNAEDVRCEEAFDLGICSCAGMRLDMANSVVCLQRSAGA